MSTQQNGNGYYQINLSLSQCLPHVTYFLAT